MKLMIYVDGGSRGNPGPAGAGVFIQDEAGEPLVETGHWLGRMTNNMAEYSSLLFALEAAKRISRDNILIFTDSQLMARQILGEYRVKNAKLKPLHTKAVEKLSRFDRWEITHIPREQNTRADSLANMAMDAGEDIVVLDKTSETKQPRPSVKKVSGTATGPIRADKPTVVVRCLKAPEKDACAATCQKGTEFVFNQTVPSGICLNVALPLLQAVLRVQSEETEHAGTTRPSPTPTNEAIIVHCDKPGCGAEFSVAKAVNASSG